MSLWFIVPVRGRPQLTKICLRQLARTCDSLTAGGLEASAVIIGDDANLEVAEDLGFGTIRQEEPLGKKWNDGFQFACDPQFNSRPVDFVVPFGSDDWVDPDLLLSAPLPLDDQIVCFRLGAVVSEDGQELARLKIRYEGGFGIRIIPAALVTAAGYRPAEEDRKRAIDSSVQKGLSRARRFRFVYHDLHDCQLVDFKSKGEQLNSYKVCLTHVYGEVSPVPWETLQGAYPSEALEDIQRFYGGRRRATA